MKKTYRLICGLDPQVRLRHQQLGFSLVELLVVVGIIMLVAASSLLVLDQTDDQARYEKSRTGYKEVHTALFGPDMLTKLSGNLVISGYLADTGRMPESLQDLLVKPVNVDPGIPDWSPVVGEALGGRIKHGWRGPYLSQTEAGLLDSWGNPWRFAVADAAVAPRNRYRSGFAPPLPPPLMEFGSLGKNGLIDLPLQPVKELYDKDFPDTTLTIGPEHFALTAVPIPRRSIERLETDPITLVVGVVYAGLNMADPFTNHPSLLRDGNGNLITYTLYGTQRTSTQTSSSSNKKPSSESKRKVTLPAGLTFNLGYARQLQLALYEPTKNGTNAAQNRLMLKLHLVDPVVFTYYPKVTSMGTEAVSQTTAVDTWQIP